ncbi:MAG: type II secretion system F family protein [Gammaproteobacteria bacterium]|nr:type II secretion system F family protein [Gammaproteobacteria bacterium]
MATTTKTTKTTKTYIWRGRDKNGKTRKSEIEAVNEQLVRTYLQKQGITPISVAEKPKALYESKGTIKTKHIVSFSRQMTTMLKAGMSVTKALGLIADGIQKPVKLREVIIDIQTSVEEGSSFSEALAQYPIYFNDLYIALVTSGEEAGVLDDTMDKIATNMEKSEAIKKKVKKAMTYPAMVVLAAIVVTGILLIKVIPVFEGFFSDFGAELPALTRMVIGFSRALRDWGWIIPVILGFAIYAFFWYKKRNRKFQRAVNKFSFKAPILGSILRLGSMARFSRTLSVLFDSGVPLVKGLYATAPATGSVIYEDATKEIAKDVENGAQLNFAMQTTEKFDSFSVQMVGIGEESGNLGDMLANVANFYEEELDYRIDNLTTVLEPLIISILALIVGTLVIAMYMPIFMIGDVVG